MMIFISTLHKHTWSNAIDKFQVCIKERKGEEMVLYGRLYVKIHLFVKMSGSFCNTHLQLFVHLEKKKKENYVSSNKYAKNLDCKANI